jgi:predicted nucleic acid-binding protein
MVRRLYLDTNIYADAFQFPKSPQARIVAAAASALFEVTVSDVLVDELRDLMRRLRDRSAGYEAIRFVAELPDHRVVHEFEWKPAFAVILPLVRDPSDAPHLAAAITGRADAFVTRNRRSVREGIFDYVPLASPETTAAALDGQRSWPDRDELRGEWQSWRRQSSRG